MPKIGVDRTPSQPFRETLYGIAVLPYMRRRLQKARESAEPKRVSRAEVARRMGLHRETIRRFELGEDALSTRHILHFAQVVNLPYVALFPPAPDSPTTLPEDPRHPLRRLNAIARHCDPEGIEAMIALLSHPARLPGCPMHTLLIDSQ